MDFKFDWPEMVAVCLLILGFALALFSGKLFVLYSVCFLMGLVFGRLWWKLGKKYLIPMFILIMAFFLGYILGGIWANLRIIALLLLAGLLIGYWLHEKKIIRTT